jgi:hypothetical protein
MCKDGVLSSFNDGFLIQLGTRSTRFVNSVDFKIRVIIHFCYCLCAM